MNKCKLLVHFQGKQDWCAIVRTANFELITAGEISSVALSRYNAVFHTFYHIAQCSIGIIENFENNVQMLSAPNKKEIKTSNQEILIILPEQQEQVEHQLNVNDYIHFSQLAIMFLQNYHFCAARECLILVKKIVCNNDDQFLKHFKPLKGLTESGYEIVTPECQDFIKLRLSPKINLANPTINDYIQQCCCSTTPKKKIKKNLIEIMKVDQAVALDIVLRNPQLFSFLPKLCTDQKIISLLVTKIKTFLIKPSNFNEFVEMFIMHASLSQILYFFFEIKDSIGFGEPSSVCRYYARFLLYNREFTKLHEVLMKYFKGNHPFGVCSINLNNFYVFLEKLKRNPTLSPSQILCPPDPRLTLFDIPPFEIILITAVFLFMKGEIDYFNSMKKFIDLILSCPSNSQMFNQCFFISIFRACQAASNQLTEPVKMINSTVYIVGDEFGSFCANRNYEGIGSVDCHLFEMLPIINLRKEADLAIKTAFWNRIKESEKYDVLVLVLGNIDFRTTLPNILGREFDSTFDSIFERVINIYINVIEDIHKMVPKVSIVVHEVFDFYIDIHLMIKKFNAMMRNKLPSYVSVMPMPDIPIESIDPKNCPPKEYYKNFRDAIFQAKVSPKCFSTSKI
ncbi:hypothetical protein M9Y10_004819 [Tritrichomonas musculus]|uniref:Uncharacterized protein n=1 Tax=Tritrichomonas musculus TaxID=1915356 RepID=A0ABR2JJK9_9EUKA